MKYILSVFIAVLLLSCNMAYSAYCGTAFFINGKGYAVTAGHVAGNASAMYAFIGGGIYPAVVLSRNMYQDIAIVHVLGLNTKYIHMQLGMQNPIAVYGFPSINGNMSTTLKQSIGTADKSFNAIAGRRTINFQAVCYPGNSGSPIMTQSGGVVGMLTSAYRPNGACAGFGPTSEAIIKDLQQSGVKYSYFSVRNVYINFSTLYYMLNSSIIVFRICHD